MKKTIYKILSFLVFPFQNSITVKFFYGYFPLGEDVKILYFSMYGEMCAIYSIEERTLNKRLLDDFKKYYPKSKFLAHYKNANAYEVTLPDHQMQHFIILLRPKLFVEFDSLNTYNIYYAHEFEDNELKKVLEIFRKNKMEGWIRNFQYINLN